MIDFSKIKITEEKLGTFGDIQLKGVIKLESQRLIHAEHLYLQPNLIDHCKLEIKRNLHNKIYGELQNPFLYIEDVIKTYVIPNMNYSPTPWFVNEKELTENLEKIRKILQSPE